MSLIVSKNTEIKTAIKNIICYTIINNKDISKPKSKYKLHTRYEFILSKVNCDFLGKWYYPDDISMQYYGDKIDKEQSSKTKEGKISGKSENYIAYNNAPLLFFKKQRRNKNIEFQDLVYECIIPKGAKYIKDKTGLAMSTSFIIKKRITSLNTSNKIIKLKCLMDVKTTSFIGGGDCQDYCRRNNLYTTVYKKDNYYFTTERWWNYAVNKKKVGIIISIPLLSSEKIENFKRHQELKNKSISFIIEKSIDYIGHYTHSIQDWDGNKLFKFIE